MRTILNIVLLSVVCLTGCAWGASQTFYQPVYFETNVYLHDATTTPLHQRVPTGAVLRVKAGENVVAPEQDLTIQGSLLIETNRTITMPYKDPSVAVSNGVTIDANGQITLVRYTSAGWSRAVINPTNPITQAMFGDRTSLGRGASNSTENGTAIGLFSYAFGSGGTAIGGGALASNYSLSVGLYANSYEYNAAVGPYANTTGKYSIAIGYAAEAYGSNAVQIGVGKNYTCDTVQIYSRKIYDRAGCLYGVSVSIGSNIVTNTQSIVVGDGLTSKEAGAVVANSFWGDGNHLTNVNVRPSFIAAQGGAQAFSATVAAKLTYSNIVHQSCIVGAACTYETTNCAWTPANVGECEIGASVRIVPAGNTTNKYVKMFLYRNGVSWADLWDYTMAGAAETPLMNPLYYFYNDIATNIYTIYVKSELNATNSAGQNSRWWGRVITK